MEIIVSQDQSRIPVMVFRPIGRINLGNADQLSKKASEAFDNGMRDLIIDLAEVPSITSAGLRTFNAIYKLLNTGSSSTGGEATEAQKIDGTARSPHLKLCNPDEDVRRVLNIAGFDMFIEIYNDKQEALVAF